MKRLFIILSLSTLSYSCSNNAEQAQDTKSTQEIRHAEKADPDPLRSNPDYNKGLDLIAQSDCLTCHKVDDMTVGPSYRDIAQKYETNAKNISLLADKIIKGGNGVWGQTPMTPHTNLSKKDAEQMVKYIMLLKSRS